LAGTFGGSIVERKCVVPAGKAILFPVINFEMNPLEKPELKTEAELIRHVREDEDDIAKLEALLDSEILPIYRVQSDPLIFPLTVPDNNSLDIPTDGITYATSDGYWVFLKPLDPGDHNLYFAGSCSSGSRNVKANYDLKVV
jgi:hypothetical protein